MDDQDLIKELKDDAKPGDKDEYMTTLDLTPLPPDPKPVEDVSATRQAFFALITLLEPLSDDGRIRLINAAANYYNISGQVGS